MRFTTKNNYQMEYKDLTQTMRNAIIDAVKTSLLKIGINVDVALSAEKTRRGNEYVYIKTSEFNTIPAIYKSCYVYGSGWFEPVESEKEVYSLNITLNYGLNYFSGGTNGVKIGTLYFRIYGDDKAVLFNGFKI